MLSVSALTVGMSKFIVTRSDNTLLIRNYLAGNAENVGTQTFQVYTGGISVALNIENTTRSLCRVINQDSGGYYYAEYVSGPNDNPGIIRIWARNPSTTSFFLTADSN